MKVFFVALALILSLGSAFAQPISTSELLTRSEQANSRCRGGSSNDESTWVACGQRDILDEMLKRSGYCYGKRGEAGYQMKWHACTPSSLR